MKCVICLLKISDNLVKKEATADIRNFMEGLWRKNNPILVHASFLTYRQKYNGIGFYRLCITRT